MGVPAANKSRNNKKPSTSSRTTTKRPDRQKKRALHDVTNKSNKGITKACKRRSSNNNNHKVLPIQRDKNAVGYEVYVQEKKDKRGILYPAVQSNKDNKYYFTPKGTTKPIVFDGRKHRLVKQTKPLSGIKENLESAFGEDQTNSQEMHSSQEKEEDVSAQESESDDDESTTEDETGSEDEFSVEQLETNRRKKNPSRRRNAPVQKEEPSPKKRKRRAATQPVARSLSQDETLDDDEYETKKFKDEEDSMGTMETTTSDWRTMSVIDY